MTDDQAAEVVPLLAALVQTDTVNPPGHEARAAAILADWLRARGVQAEVRPLSDTRANLLARLPGRGDNPALVFCGHLDTVPPGNAQWGHGPFSGECIGERMYGRGTADMKGGLAAMAGAIAALRQRSPQLSGDVLFLATAGEEVDSCGARQLVEEGVFQGAGAMVIGEPTGLKLATAHKGALWLRVHIPGKAAHGSMPQFGSNAILDTCRFLQALTEFRFGFVPHPLLSAPTISPNLVQGGIGVNIVPDHCAVSLDIRTLPGQSHPHTLETIGRLLSEVLAGKEVGSAHHEVLLDRAPIDTDRKSRIVQVAEQAYTEIMGEVPLLHGMAYYTDASAIVPALGVPTVILGPGEADEAHQTNESVELPQVRLAARLYEQLAVLYDSI